jgi:hypothetical protein
MMVVGNTGISNGGGSRIKKDVDPVDLQSTRLPPTDFWRHIHHRFDIDLDHQAKDHSGKAGLRLFSLQDFFDKISGAML